MTIPIPHRASGFVMGAANANVTIDVFVDLQCPYSKQAWPTLMSLVEHYKNQSVSLRTHLITLSNHRQAWDMSLGLFAFAQGDVERFYSFASFMYQNQEQFYNAEFKHKTHNDLQQLVADLAQQHAQINREVFLKRMADEDIYILARTPIRYAATRAVWATPTMFVNNGAKLPVNHRSPLEHWIALIDPLLSDEA